MDIWSSVSGMVAVKITTADPEGILQTLIEHNIVFNNVHFGNDLTVSGLIEKKDYKALQEIVRKKQGDISRCDRVGAYWTIKRFLIRPLMLVIIAILVLSVFYLPGRILFVRVEGNTQIPAKKILEEAQYCGIRFGASRRYVRSEKTKNKLLDSMLELDWVGINTSGCVATISVKERDRVTEFDLSAPVKSIVAAHDGIVGQCTIHRGNKLCDVGSAVKAGQILVSGYTDCGIAIKVTGAEAEIYGQTMRKVSAISLTTTQQRTKEGNRKRKYALRIGKKQINFHKGSGISDTGCVKIKRTRYLTLPGGFELPVALITTEEITYIHNKTEIDVYELLPQYVRNYLKTQMVAGRILTEESNVEQIDNALLLSGTYYCYELIGIPRYEEIAVK